MSSKWSIVELKESTEVALSLVGWRWTRADDLKSSVNMVQYGLEHYTVETGSFVGECDSMGFFIQKHWKRCIISRHLWIAELHSWGNWTTEIHDRVQLDPVALQFHWSLLPGGRLLSKRVGSLLDVYHMMTMNLSRNGRGSESVQAEMKGFWWELRLKVLRYDWLAKRHTGRAEHAAHILRIWGGFRSCLTNRSGTTTVFWHDVGDVIATHGW